MTRSLKKGPFIDYDLYTKINKFISSNEKKTIKTWSRRSMILPSMVGLLFLVHNGKQHIPVYVTSTMVGHKLGEYSLTRSFKKHNIIEKKKTTRYDEKSV